MRLARDGKGGRRCYSQGVDFVVEMFCEAKTVECWGPFDAALRSPKTDWNQVLMDYQEADEEVVLFLVSLSLTCEGLPRRSHWARDVDSQFPLLIPD